MSLTASQLQAMLTKKSLSITDQMGHANMGKVVRGAFTTMDALHRETVAVQMMSHALMLLVHCQKQGVNPRDVLYKASAVITDAASANNEHIRAIEHFMKVHLRGEAEDLMG